MKFLMFVIIFLLLGGFFIISEQRIQLNNKQNIDYFFDSYSKWFDSLFRNANSMAGYVIRMEWLPKNT